METELRSIFILAGTVLLTAIVAGLYFTGRARRKVNYMLDALEDKETNFRFREEKGLDKKFNKTLNRLRKIFEKEKNEIIQQERYYGQMLDHVQTGIVVIDSDGERISYCNTKALQILGMATFSNIRQLRRISEPLAESFRKVAEGVEEKASYFNESSRITISITASSAVIRGSNVKIVAFNDISSDIEENESASWTRLIRVLTHEIMNTVTPIASLSDALAKYAESRSGDLTGGTQEDSKTGGTHEGSKTGGTHEGSKTGSTQEDSKTGGTQEDSQADSVQERTPDIKAGLETIASSSKGLIRFVESYRNLTHIATPVRKAFFLRELVSNVRELTKEQFMKSGASFSYNEKDDDILLYADEGQISQILVNLLKNALQAGADRIWIEAWIDSAESVVVDVCNNGSPITKESQEEIFVPFFTTKPTGTGIGLSISRQIMRLHNGTLRLTCSDDRHTVFTLIFR